MSADMEYTQGKTIVDVAEKVSGLEVFVWASLPDAKKISNGKFSNIFHWQSKAAVADHIRTEKLKLWAKTTVILFPNYFENCQTWPDLYLPVKVYLFIFILEENTRIIPLLLRLVSKTMACMCKPFLSARRLLYQTWLLQTQEN